MVFLLKGTRYQGVIKMVTNIERQISSCSTCGILVLSQVLIASRSDTSLHNSLHLVQRYVPINDLCSGYVNGLQKQIFQIIYRKGIASIQSFRHGNTKRYIGLRVFITSVVSK